MDLTIMAGMPGSGKTRWAKTQWTQAPRIRVVSSDVVRAQLGAGRDHHEDVKREFMRQVAAGLLEEPVIADATNLHPVWREELRGMVGSRGGAVRLVLFANEDQAFASNAERSDRVPEEAMLKMRQRLDRVILDLLDGEHRHYASVTVINRRAG